MVSLVTIIWSATAGAALVLGIVHALVGVYDRRARGNLAFAFAALGLATATMFELEMLSAGSPERWGELLWWMHLPMSVLVVGMAVFMHLHLGAGRRWLLMALIAMRAVILVLNFISDPNFNFQRIDAVGQIHFLGEPVTVVTSAVTGQYQWLALAAAVLFPLFIIDVVVALWRRGTAEARRMALVVGGPVLASVLLSWTLTQLVIWRFVALPMLLVPPFVIALGAMALEVSRNVLRAGALAHDLRESEQRLELAADAAGAGLWAWDSSTKRMWATDRARAIMGLDAGADIRLDDLLRIIDPADEHELTVALHAALTHGGQHAMHFRIVAPDGSVRWIAAQGTVELDTHGQCSLVRGVVRDVTQQHRAADETNELQRKLAHAGRVTTLGQLSAALAHEISQPLSAIQQNGETAQLLLGRPSVDLGELRAVVDDIVRDNHRAAEVVQRLRKWLKQGHMQRETISLDELAEDVLALIRSEVTVKHITVECAVPHTLPPVCGDRIHLSQVLLNLVLNAIDASTQARETRQRVSISANLADAGSCCEVCVSDSGPGIPPDQLNRIFDPFVTSKSEGMGMGLSISRAIVEAHGGKLWAENDARGGATFHFTVPVNA